MLHRVMLAAATTIFLVTLPAFGSGCPAADGGEGEGEGDGGEGEGGEGEGEACDVDNVSDGPTADTVTAGATTLICYYHQPSEGYCRKITNSAEVDNFFNGGNDKGAIGCADAVILGDTECPTLNAVGRCDDTNIEAQRVYYTCSKFDDPAANCAAVGGTFTAL